MTKQQKKERALLLMAYAFLKVTYENTNEISIKDKTQADFILERVYKKLDNIKKIFVNEKIRNFLLKRVPDDISKTTDIAIVAIVVLAYFKMFNLTKEINLVEDLEFLTKQAVYSTDKETAINSIKYASDLVADVFPNKKGLIEFKKLANKFPFNLIKELEDVRKTA
ncbi:hypothetical protein JCM11957_06990 [Caminibacter profundus]